MTRKVFWDNPYLTTLTTRIAHVDGSDVFLEETIFFAFSGGQESDAGSIAGKSVIRAEVRDREIAYTLSDNHGLSAGDSVVILIDRERRYRLMKLHFAAELVLETVYRTFPGIEKIGAHISEHKARLDFLLNESITPYLQKISDNVTALIQSDYPIISDYEDKDTERRYWKIDGFAQVPCGGTHLKTTGEIGPIRLKRNNIGKGKERIEIELSSI